MTTATSLAYQLGAVRRLHFELQSNGIPPNGEFPVHTPQMVLTPDLRRERELLIQQSPVSVKRDGQAYIYTLPSGEVMVSYCRPEAYQWQPGP